MVLSVLQLAVRQCGQRQGGVTGKGLERDLAVQLSGALMEGVNQGEGDHVEDGGQHFLKEPAGKFVVQFQVNPAAPIRQGGEAPCAVKALKGAFFQAHGNGFGRYVAVASGKAGGKSVKFNGQGCQEGFSIA